MPSSVCFESAIAYNDSEVFFRSARCHSTKVTVGQCFLATLDVGGPAIFFKVDSLYVPIRRRAPASCGGISNRMVSVSAYYPPSYLSHDVNYGIKLKKVKASTQRSLSEITPSSTCVGFQRVFAPPVVHELVMHPRPLTLRLEDFVNIINNNSINDIKDWPQTGMSTPTFIVSQLHSTDSSSQFSIIPVSVYNRLCKYQSAIEQGRFCQWTMHTSKLQRSVGLCLSDNSYIFFYRRKHSLYQLNRSPLRREQLAPKHRGLVKEISDLTELQCFKTLQLVNSVTGRITQKRKLRKRMRNSVGVTVAAKTNRKTRRGRPSNKSVGRRTMNSILGRKRSSNSVEAAIEQPKMKKRRGRPPKSIEPTLQVSVEESQQQQTQSLKCDLRESLDDIFDSVLNTPSCDQQQPMKQEEIVAVTQQLTCSVEEDTDFSKLSSHSSSSHTTTNQAVSPVPYSYHNQLRDCLQPITPPPPMDPQPLSIWVPQKTPCYNTHPLNVAYRPTMGPIFIPLSFIPAGTSTNLPFYNVTQLSNIANFL